MLCLVEKVSIAKVNTTIFSKSKCITTYFMRKKSTIVLYHEISQTDTFSWSSQDLYATSAARIILDAAPDAPSQPLFNDLNWLNIFERIQYSKGILMYKILNGLSPTYLHNLFTPQSSSTYHSRSVSNRNLCIPRHSTESFKRTLQYSGAKLWNSLPLNIRASKSIISFKRNFQKFIISKRNRFR